jgi:teichoic acid transport system permease protein
MTSTTTPPVTESQPSAAELAAHYGLIRAGTRPSLRSYLSALWQRRHFTWSLTLARFHATNSEDRLGLLWYGLRPLIQAAIYGVIFGLLLPSSTRPDNYVAFVVIGVFLFHYSSGCLVKGTKSIVKNISLVRSVHFPRAILPISSTGQETLSLGVVLSMMIVICLITGLRPQWSWLLAIPAIVMLIMFSVGLGLVCARITAQVRDFAQLLPHVLRIIFYCSGILYDVDRFDAHQKVFDVIKLTPFYTYIALTRNAIFGSGYATSTTWIVAAVWSLAVLPLGLIYFWRAEEKYGRD